MMICWFLHYFVRVFSHNTSEVALLGDSWTLNVGPLKRHTRKLPVGKKKYFALETEGFPYFIPHTCVFDYYNQQATIVLIHQPILVVNI